jgi:hypothetical protein
MSSRFFFNTRFSGESGCKDTTIFYSDKYFFLACGDIRIESTAVQLFSLKNIFSY